MTTTAATRQAAKVQPAQVGNGKAAHYVTAERFEADALCGRTVSRVLDDRAAAKMAGECTRCVKAVERRAADTTPAPEPTAPAAAPAEILPLPTDVTTPATMFDPALTYFADGTPVVMRWTGGEKAGTTAGMTVGRSPYEYQVVAFEDGTTSNAAPHTLHRADPPAPTYTAEYETVRVDGRTVDRITVRSSAQDTPVVFTQFPHDPAGNAGNNLAQLGWTITGMQAYGGPTLFHAHVEPSPQAPTQTRRLTPDQARQVVIVTFPQAQDFEPLHDRAGRFLGYTFQSAPTRTPRFGWITNASSYSRELERYRFAAKLLLPAAVLEDQSAAQCRTSVLEETAARLIARTAYSNAHGFQPVAAGTAPDRVIGWTFRAGFGGSARYGWVTCLGRLISRFGTEYRWQAETAILGHHQAGTLAPAGPDMVALLAEVPEAEVLRILGALRVDEGPAENAPGRRVVEGVIVEHDGATWGSSPRHAGHPDVIAARRALDGLSAARLTDHHGDSDLTEEEQEVRGYVIEPRGHGRVGLSWMEGGKPIRRDTPVYGAGLDCLADRMRREGWNPERMLPSSPVLFAYVPQGQRQG